MVRSSPSSTVILGDQPSFLVIKLLLLFNQYISPGRESFVSQLIVPVKLILSAINAA